MDMILRRGKDALFAAALVGLGLLFAAFPARAGESFAAALQACASSLLPALFPFFVIGRLLVECPGSEVLARPLRPLCRFLGLPGPKAPLLLFLGWLGGYSALAAALSAALNRGEISPGEGERLLVAGVISSPGFTAAVGGNMLGRPALGWAFYGSALAANLLCALALRAFCGPLSCRLETAPPPAALPAGLGGAIAGGASACLSVCGCVVFFRMLLSPLSGQGFLPPLGGAALAGLAEVSSGCLAWAALGGGAALWGCCGAMSLLSLSVWSQLKALLGGRCSLRLLALTRPAHLGLSFLCMRLVLRLMPGESDALSTLAPRVISTWRLAPDRAFLLFALCCLTLQALAAGQAE